MGYYFNCNNGEGLAGRIVKMADVKGTVETGMSSNPYKQEGNPGSANSSMFGAKKPAPPPSSVWDNIFKNDMGIAGVTANPMTASTFTINSYNAVGGEIVLRIDSGVPVFKQKKIT
ncbi:hypothetical protein CHS0354_018423 [Potamilus streckersoni]|uniref:Uncharacterized protein n=1 Tax=Potamilus streckersoni TaxID=2493646 RepID=A0AAE0TBK3_9BIVA|nr:hypothetical protein CHS0354_018423 [Potamilus streckersoni]